MEVLKTSQEIVHEGWLIKSPPTKLWRAVGIIKYYADPCVAYASLIHGVPRRRTWVIVYVCPGSPNSPLFFLIRERSRPWTPGRRLISRERPEHRLGDDSPGSLLAREISRPNLIRENSYARLFSLLLDAFPLATQVNANVTLSFFSLNE